MSKVYKSKPNIVKITVEDEDGSNQELHAVGYSIEDVVEAVTLSLDGAESKSPVVARKKHNRRTKVQIAAAKDLASQPREDASEPVAAGAGKSWP